jgi:PhzF family phenazine biosynthesis protein
MPPLVLVDAFTDRPFTGNPAAVCVLQAPADADWMQAVAAELNLPATAFVWPQRDLWCLRWFAPVAELAMCGHGTLAAAYVLLEQSAAAHGSICFETAAGQLTARRLAELIELDFPSEPSSSTEPPAALLQAIGVNPVTAERNRLDYLVELESEAAVRSLHPDLTALRDVDTRGVIVTAPATSADADFVSRFFAPPLWTRRGPRHRVRALLSGSVLGAPTWPHFAHWPSAVAQRWRRARPG